LGSYSKRHYDAKISQVRQQAINVVINENVINLSCVTCYLCYY